VDVGIEAVTSGRHTFSIVIMITHSLAIIFDETTEAECAISKMLTTLEISWNLLVLEKLGNY
jgi:hypothetical protein